MKCPKCGVDIQEGKLLCESCGEEIHIVPDFEPEIENRIDPYFSHTHLRFLPFFFYSFFLH